MLLHWKMWGHGCCDYMLMYMYGWTRILLSSDWANTDSRVTGTWRQAKKCEYYPDVVISIRNLTQNFKWSVFLYIVLLCAPRRQRHDCYTRCCTCYLQISSSTFHFHPHLPAVESQTTKQLLRSSEPHPSPLSALIPQIQRLSSLNSWPFEEDGLSQGQQSQRLGAVAKDSNSNVQSCN